MTDDYKDSERPGEDNGRRSRQPRSTGSNRTLWLILGGTGCSIVLVCGGIVALAVWGVSAFTKDFPAVEGVANEFFDAVKAGNLEVAFNKTSAGYRAKNTPEQFASFIEQHETFSKHTTRTMNGFNIYSGTNGKQARIQMTLQAPNNATTCTLILVDEGGAWKVNQISVP